MNKKYKTKKQADKATLKSIAKCQKATMTAMTFRFHNINDQAVIEKLNSVENKTDYIRQLILKDLEK